MQTFASQKIEFVKANGLDFGYIGQGEGPLVLCFHGFPDTPYTYLDLMQRLSAKGYRVVAPFTRGYAPSSIPTDHSYTMEDFGADALGLITALGEDRAYLIGHDWGATAVYAASKMGPEKIIKAVTAAVPHPLAFKLSPQQLRKSWYMFFFQLPYVSERKLKKNDYALIRKLWRDWSPKLSESASSDLISAFKKSLEKDENLLAALGYYRALFKPKNVARVQRMMATPISVPTLTIAGQQDGCIGEAHFPAMAEHFSEEFELLIMEGAGHFMHKEQPEQFAEAVLNYFSSD